MPDTIPEPRKLWREEARPSKEKILLDFEAPERVSNERYKTYPNGYDGDAFFEKWRDPKEEEVIGTPTATISCSDATEMKNFIDEQLQRWGFPSTEEYQQAKLNNLRQRYQRQLDHCLSKKKEEEIRRMMRDHLEDEKKNRRRIRHQFQLEWKFATASIVSGLKYDPLSNTFAARLDYWEITPARKKYGVKLQFQFQKNGLRKLILTGASSNMSLILDSLMTLWKFLLESPEILSWCT